MLYFVGPVRKKIKRLESNQQNTKSRVELVEDGINVVEDKVNVVEGTMNVVKNTVLNLQGTHTRNTTKEENNQLTLTLPNYITYFFFLKKLLFRIVITNLRNHTVYIVQNSTSLQNKQAVTFGILRMAT